MIKKQIIPICFVFMIALSACNVQQINKDNIPEVPKEYRSFSFNNTDTIALSSIPWKTFYQDEELQHLIEIALKQNTDLQLALKNIESAQLYLKQTKLRNIPNLQLNAGMSSTSLSKNSLNGQSVNQFLGQNHLEDYNVSIGFSWEADIWGKIKNQQKAGQAVFLQTQETRKAIHTELISQVAKGYYQLVALHELKKVAQHNMELSKGTLKLARYQYQVGDLTSMALDQLESQYLSALILIPNFEQQIAMQENALRALCSDFPAEIHVNNTLNDTVMSTPFSIGIPAELLGNRPDVKRAELEIMAFEAYEKEAYANMYPSITISAQAGVNALKSSNWFNLPASLFGVVAGGITQPLFQKKELRTKHEQAKIAYEKSVIQFRQQVVIAVNEVSDALITLEKLSDQGEILRTKSLRLNSAIQQANLLFASGNISYLEVISAQQNLLQTDLEIIQNKKLERNALVDLYRSLGGGSN